jgi:molecular chaperone GrpE
MIRSKKNNLSDFNDQNDKENIADVNTQEFTNNSSSDATGSEEKQAHENHSKEPTGKDSQDLVKLRNEEIEKLKKDIETLTDTMKRRQADFENYKKRMIKSQDDQKKHIIKDFAQDVIDINDDLLRAMDATCNVKPDQTVTDVCNSFSNGFSMISKRIEETLIKYGIKEIISINMPFDPIYNEAVEIDESSEVDVDTITKVHQKGFHIDDFVIRASKVKVTKAKKKSDSTEQGNSEMAVNNDTI